MKHSFDGKYVLYCAGATMTCILVIWISARLVFRDKSLVGEFVQGAYRGSAAILGIALVTNISGNAGMSSLMMLGSVPLYNIFAVIVLTFEAVYRTEGTFSASEKEQRKQASHEKIKKACIGIGKNPIILSIIGGMLLSYAGFTLPKIPYKTVSSIGSLTTPLALLAIGAGFEGRKAVKKLKPTLMATFIKLIVQPAVFLPVAIALDFGTDKLVAALIMLGAPTTATSYIMAKNMGHEGVLSASIVVMTMLLSAFTITAWVFVLKTGHLI